MAPDGGAFDAPDVAAAGVRKRLAGRRALLLSDFDGTLAELVPIPGEAAMADAVRVELDRLAAHAMITLGVVSGRRLMDVRSRVGDTPEFVAGLHGLEIVAPDEMFVHPVLEEVAPVIRDLARAAARDLSSLPGVLVEDKTFGLTCHVRQASPEDAARALELFRALAAPAVERGLLRLLPGSKIFELVPAVDWHKGRAVEWIRAREQARHTDSMSVIYLGDDRTDEDAFAVLGPDDVAIGVGPRPGAPLIQWRLSGPASVGRFFARLAAPG